MEAERFLDLNYQRRKLTRFFNSLSDKEQQRAFKALSWAEQAHFSQFRDSGAPYIIHPIRSTLILAEELAIQDNALLCAALLHDAVEDAQITIEHIKNEFGTETARLIEGVTRPRPAEETEEQKLINKPKKFQQIAKSDEKIRILKLCDVLDNMRSMEYIPETHPSYKKISRWKEELKQYVLPIAKETHQKLYNLLNQFSE